MADKNIDSERAISEITNILKIIESIKGAKGINSAIRTSMRKRLKFLKMYQTKGEEVPHLMLKETKEEFKNMKLPEKK